MISAVSGHSPHQAETAAATAQPQKTTSAHSSAAPQDTVKLSSQAQSPQKAAASGDRDKDGDSK